ncbi:MAG: pentapeptide repeat-containing protein [Gloeomargarita sp. SKYB31]|nr:pentapeptide repeat-containing protein [Gloeomargarita sp. SKYB31]
MIALSGFFFGISCFFFLSGPPPAESIWWSVVLFFMSLTLFVWGLRLRRYDGEAKAIPIVMFVEAGLMVLLAAGMLAYSATRHLACRFVGPGRNLSYCSFEGRDFSNQDLSNAILRYAQLDNVDFTRANLSNVDFTGADLSGANLSDAIVKGINLRSATLVNITGIDDETLAAALQIDPNRLYWVTAQEEIRLEKRETILSTLSAACRGLPVANAHRMSSAGPYTIVFLGGQGAVIEGWSDIPAERKWEPMAVRFADLVACIDEEWSPVQRCAYIGGPPITRYQHQIQVRVVVATTGRVLSQNTFYGSEPRDCPLSAPVSQTEIRGSEVRRASIIDWLSEVIQFLSEPR